MFDSDDNLRKNYRVLLAFFRARLSTKHARAAEDLAQDTLVAALRSRVGSNPSHVENIPAYLLGIARHKLTDYIDAESRRPPTVSLDGPEDQPAPEELARVVEETRTDETATLEIVARALSELAPQEREVLVLRYLDRLSNAVTAQRLGLDPDEASRLKYRALEKIRRRVRANEGRRP